MEGIKKSLTFGIVFFFVFVGNAVSEETAIEAKMELQQVALFKNGLGFFISEVAIPGKTRSFYVVPPAAASHGTFWVSYPPKVEIESVVARQVEAKVQVEATTIVDLLKSNIGRKMRIYLPPVDKEDVSVEGKLVMVTEEPPSVPPNPYVPGRVIGDESRASYGMRNTVLLQTSNGQVVFGADRIVRVDFPEGGPAMKYEKKSRAVRLDVALNKAAGGQKLVVSYLAKGVTWAPSYMVDITEPDTAKLAAKAEVMDEVCDLNGVDVQLVTGYPNLQFADIASPLAMKEDLAQFLQSLIRGQSEQGRVRGVLSNVMAQSMAYDRLATAGEVSAMPMYGVAEAGVTAEDLFLYPIEKVRLPRGAVGYFPLFTESVPYTHIYRWEIPDYVRPEGDYYGPPRQQPQPEQQEVWHCIRLENVMKLPWTTAPAEIVKDGVILGQDTLNYTPVKDKGTVKITRAMNVKAEQLELETDRKRDAAQWYGYHYDLVAVDGKLSVANLQGKPITLEVVKMLSGEVKSMQPEAKLEKLAKALRAVNANVKLTWTFELAAGDKKEIGYTYEVYVRR